MRVRQVSGSRLAANPPRALALPPRFEDRERSPDALIAMVDIGAGSGYSCAMFS
jgi:hypothetical protein